MKLGRALADPLDEARKPWMAAQRINAVIAACKLGLGQCGMDFTMANLMQQDRRPPFAAAQLGDQVMQALLRLRRDRAVAKGANRVCVRAHGLRLWLRSGQEGGGN